jgi:hypothetical protein
VRPHERFEPAGIAHPGLSRPRAATYQEHRSCAKVAGTGSGWADARGDA